MICKQCQEKILESLAAGAAQLPREVSDHQRTCSVCREFHQAEASLFRSMDAGLQAMANQAMPPSLLPGLRGRMGVPPALRRGWIPNRSFAVTIAAVAILAVSIGYVFRRPESHLNSPASDQVVSRSISNPAAAVQTPRKPLTGLPRRNHTKPSSPASIAAFPEGSPEVLVLAEERQAFAQFVAELPERREIALAMTRPAPAPADVPVEIALLKIENLELKPLEGTPRE